MIAPLLLGVFAIYMIIGWVFIAALDRRIARRRSAPSLWIGLLFWPVTVVVDLVSGRQNH